MMGNSRRTWQLIVGIFTFWIILLLYMGTSLYQADDDAKTERQLAKALKDLDQLKRQNMELQGLAKDLKKIQIAFENGNHIDIKQKISEASVAMEQIGKPQQTISINGEPNLDQEVLRRKSENGVVELWYYLSSQLSKLKDALKDNPGLQRKVDEIYLNSADHKQTILVDLHNMSEVGGMDKWREQEAWELGRIVQNRLKYLQNPKDCSSAKKIVCNLNKGCGYGCQLHHMVYCFIVAYGTERTFILESKGWRYSPSGWERFFLPLSETCRDSSGKNRKGWGPLHSITDTQVIDLPIVDSMHPKPDFMPLAIPEDLGPRLARLHGHPIVWWIGQFIAYLTRPQPGLAVDIEEAMQKIGFKKPIVGLHVRRTDKVGTEAAFHSIHEYMVFVEEYFDLLERKQKVDKRRIFLASDDPNVLADAKKGYPHYEIISDNAISKTAGLGSRYSERSLRGVILDIHFLSQCNYLVCTFSSQVCRVAYEIMQTMHPDASSYFHSLDDIFYYGGQNGHYQVAQNPHKSQNPEEMDLLKGDYLGVAGNHWNGFSKGTNKRTGKVGLYPSYKVKDHAIYAKFPKYEEADKMLNNS